MPAFLARQRARLTIALFSSCAGLACSPLSARWAPQSAGSAAADPVIPAVEMRFDRGEHDAGVQALVRTIGDAQVVMLGEQWHGDGGAIRARAEVVKILHEHLGFDVLVFEADFYSLQRGWERVRAGDNLREFAENNIYHFWSRSRAAQPLWRYVEAQRVTGRPLEIAGMDVRHLGAIAREDLPVELDARLSRVARADSAERARFRTLLERLLRNEWNRPSDADQGFFLRTLDRLQVALRSRDSTSRDLFWEHELDNLRNAARYGWQGASRDRAMGQNLAWLATHVYPKRKIIVWAHNNHIIKDKWMYYGASDTLVTRGNALRSLADIARATYLGHEARQFFGPAVFSLAVLSGSGTYSPDVRTEDLRQRGNFDSLATIAPAPPGTVEHALSRTGHRLALVDLRETSSRELLTRALDYAHFPPMRMPYRDGFDAFLYLDRTIGLNEERPRDWPVGQTQQRE